MTIHSFGQSIINSIYLSTGVITICNLFYGGKISFNNKGDGADLPHGFVVELVDFIVLL
jgi:hypothetical protein